MDVDGGALLADALRAGFTQSDIGWRLGWQDLRVLAEHPAVTSETMRRADPELWAWCTVAPPYLMAAVVDHLAALRWQLGSGRGERPTPVQRPHANSGDTESRHFGADPIPVSDFEEWWWSDGC